MYHNVNLNDAPADPAWNDGCLPVAIGAAALVACALFTAYSGYAQLTQEETHDYAMKIQRTWHYQNYSEAARAEILARVKRLVEANPRGYLAKVWREVYR